jgi:outer membrane lipoprotein LolB
VCRWPAAALALLLLQGCVSRPAIPTDAAGLERRWTERQTLLSSAPGFAAEGRIAVKGGGLSGAWRWQQQGETFALRIAGPFGAAALSISGTPGAVTIRGKDIDLVTAEPDAVLAARTGWVLPIAALRWWVLGLPAPGSASEVNFDAEGRAAELRQDGWQVRYTRYAEGPEPALPSRLEATAETGGKALQATLVFERFELLAAGP